MSLKKTNTAIAEAALRLVSRIKYGVNTSYCSFKFLHQRQHKRKLLASLIEQTLSKKIK